MDKIHDAVAWYQKKIGYNDKQLWEQSVEMKLQKGPSNVHSAPRKSVRLKTEFIDVDLIRGSTFSKAKPKVSLTAISGNAIIRVLLLPLFFRWWVVQSSWLFFLFLLYLYTQQIVTMVVYFRTVGEITEDELSLTEVMLPAILMVILAIVHSQTVVSHFSHKAPHRDHHKKLNRSFSKSKKHVNKMNVSSGTQKSSSTIDSTYRSHLGSSIVHDMVLEESESANSSPSKINLVRTKTSEKKKNKDLSSQVRKDSQKNTDSSSINVLSQSAKFPETGGQPSKEKKNLENGIAVMTGKVALNADNKTRLLQCECGRRQCRKCSDEKADISGKTDSSVSSAEVVDSYEEGFSSLEPEDVRGISRGSDKSVCRSVRQGCEEDNFADNERLSDDVRTESDSESKTCLNELDKKMQDLRDVSDVGQNSSKNSHLELSRKLSDLVKNSVESDLDEGSDNENHADTKAKVSLSGTSLRRRRRVSANKSADLGEIARSRVVPNKLGLWSHSVKSGNNVGSSSECETTPGPATPDAGHKVNMSSEEWDDRIQSDVTTSSSYSSSCGSEGEISDSGENQRDIEELHKQGWTASNLHVINLLQPPTTSSTGGNHIPLPDKVSCVMWEGNECKKVDLTALDIGWAIIDKVDNMPESSDCILVGILMSFAMASVPFIFRFYHAKQIPSFYTLAGLSCIGEQFLQNPWRRNLFTTNGIIQRLCLSLIFFFLLSVADRTFKQRLLYAKHFCYLTSSRRARKFDMPHFRLSKVRNIKTWLSLRSYLKRRGPQRSVDVIVSATFLLAICCVTFMCLQMLKDADTYLDFECNWELVVWCLALGIYLLRFMTLGLKINKKYRNLSVLITEQINLYLQMEQKPHKKEELMLANNVLKLAEDLLKELESPFKISGFSANPLIYNMTKVVVLSAFSAVLTELLGFKLKLYKIKFKA